MHIQRCFWSILATVLVHWIVPVIDSIRDIIGYLWAVLLKL